ncbi:hypothetical protein DXG03_004762 [Asterophora parasitica]|uniref:Uncharacterized protein n=1 Tax=Asterophora parasitica TaxID=117018 RepID=A0A9P7GEQ7_9AGAR|nr:hypothetical protein DXG03_004762 [Asterophora parasitica]
MRRIYTQNIIRLSSTTSQLSHHLTLSVSQAQHLNSSLGAAAIGSALSSARLEETLAELRKSTLGLRESTLKLTASTQMEMKRLWNMTEAAALREREVKARMGWGWAQGEWAWVLWGALRLVGVVLPDEASFERLTQFVGFRIFTGTLSLVVALLRGLGSACLVRTRPRPERF